MEEGRDATAEDSDSCHMTSNKEGDVEGEESSLSSVIYMYGDRRSLTNQNHHNLGICGAVLQCAFLSSSKPSVYIL